MLEAQDISMALLLVGKEVEGRRSCQMSYGFDGLPDRRVRNNPTNLMGADTEARFGRIQGCG